VSFYLQMDDSYLREENERIVMLQEYMEKVRKEALDSLSNSQIAAIFENFSEFVVRLREEEDFFNPSEDI